MLCIDELTPIEVHRFQARNLVVGKEVLSRLLVDGYRDIVNQGKSMSM